MNKDLLLDICVFFPGWRGPNGRAFSSFSGFFFFFFRSVRQGD